MSSHPTDLPIFIPTRQTGQEEYCTKYSAIATDSIWQQDEHVEMTNSHEHTVKGTA